jgi:hypothetical protein
MPSADTPSSDKRYPVYGDSLVIANTRSIACEDKDLGELPDRRAIRSMSRASVMLSIVSLPAQKLLEKYLSADPFSVGVYCAVNHGPDDYECAKELLDAPDAEFAVRYKKARSPKHYLKQLPNLAPAQMGIFLGIMGPVNTFNHATEGSYQAMDHAEFDLRTNKVQAALVCTAFSLEDPLLSLKTQTEGPKSAILTEGAAAFLFARAPQGGESYGKKMSMLRGFVGPEYYGIADPLMQLFRKEH